MPIISPNAPCHSSHANEPLKYRIQLYALTENGKCLSDNVSVYQYLSQHLWYICERRGRTTEAIPQDIWRQWNIWKTSARPMCIEPRKAIPDWCKDSHYGVYDSTVVILHVGHASLWFSDVRYQSDNWHAILELWTYSPEELKHKGKMSIWPIWLSSCGKAYVRKWRSKFQVLPEETLWDNAWQRGLPIQLQWIIPKTGIRARAP